MRHTLICTVGTSLIYPNLSNLPKDETGYQLWIEKQLEEDKQCLSIETVFNLRKYFDTRDDQKIAEVLLNIPSHVRICGAEINSIDDLIKYQICPDKCNLFFCYSATSDGEKVSHILKHYYELKGYKVKLEEIKDLQDENPKSFRTKGLRNLAKTISKIAQEQGTAHSAINSTGGYKAQIAIAVLIGQALGIPVYYKHERFSEIISFPPMPIALDFDLWLQISGSLNALERKELIAYEELPNDWNEKFETLIEKELDEKDGKTYVILSPTGQIFHDTFKGKFSSIRDKILPPPVPMQQKKQPHLTHHSWGNAGTKILNYLRQITNDISYVSTCRTEYWNPDLSEENLFRLKGEQVEGIYSNGTWTVKFYVETSANTIGQKAACVADLNTHLDQNKFKL